MVQADLLTSPPTDALIPYGAKLSLTTVWHSEGRQNVKYKTLVSPWKIIWPVLFISCPPASRDCY